MRIKVKVLSNKLVHFLLLLLTDINFLSYLENYWNLDLEWRAVIKRQGKGIFPAYCEHGPRLFSEENITKIEPKEIPSSFTPCLLVVFTWYPYWMSTITDFLACKFSGLLRNGLSPFSAHPRRSINPGEFNIGLTGHYCYDTKGNQVHLSLLWRSFYKRNLHLSTETA